MEGELIETVDVHFVVHPSDVAALVALYEATGGDNWEEAAGWLDEPTISQWQGVTVEAGRVVAVSLQANGLTGAIPAELGNLDRLESLDLRLNNLSGSIPTALGNLERLESLDLRWNEIPGEIPAELGGLLSLESLRLAENAFAGEIPPELGNLSNLRSLDLSGNDLSGEIPPELGDLGSLLTLSLHTNNLEGAIPGELGSLANLQTLWLGLNELDGEIPVELANLSNLRNLDLADNHLSGEIPSELGGLENLRNLRLENNDLTGDLPSALANLEALEVLRISGNPLTGAIPVAFVGLGQMESFRFDGTELCEPPDPDFQDWLGNIDDVNGTGVLCEPPPEPGISVDPDEILADGEATSLITVTWPVAGENIFLETTAGVLGSVTDHGDGSYSAELTASNDVGVAVVTAYVGEDAQGEEIGSLSVAFVPGPAVRIAFATEPRTVGAGEISETVVLELRDAYENVAASVGATTIDLTSVGGGTFLNEDGTGEIDSLTIDAGDSEATFRYRAFFADTHEITAEDAAGVLTSASQQLTVLPGAISVGEGATEMQGENLVRAANGEEAATISVQLFDDFGNRVPQEGVETVFATNLGTLSSQETGTDEDGRAAVSLTSTRAGQAEVTASLILDGIEEPVWTGAPVVVTFTPGSPSRLAFATQPEDTVAGDAIPGVTVRIEDDLGNLIEDATEEIGVSIQDNPAGGELSGTSTLAAENGIAVFDDLRIDRAGEGYTLVAEAVDLEGVVSEAFVIFAGEPDADASMVWVETDEITADGESVTEVFIDVRDALGNEVADGGDTVFLETEAGSLGDLVDHGDGTYSAELTSSTELGTVEVSAYLGPDASAEQIGKIEVHFVIHPGDVAALTALYQATDGDNWRSNTDWLSEPAVTRWSGITVEAGRVVQLRLWRNGLKGTIPPELEKLTELRTLTIALNRSSDSIPGNLTGEIPAELGNLVNLVRLELLGNNLTGEIPPELGNLENLQTLNLSLNDLRGEIPAELGSLINLRHSNLSANALSGEIPPELGNLEELQTLDLGRNDLSGAIPAELGNLMSLWALRLNSNALTGEVPSELGNLEDLNTLNLSANDLNGEIPAELGNLKKLQWLFLNSNSLTGSLPHELTQIPVDRIWPRGLQLFYFHNTDLCEPPDNEFQEWLADIGRVSFFNNEPSIV